MGQVVIGVDVGTTAVKVAAFGIESPRRAATSREYPLAHPHPGWAVQDPQVITDALIAALTECVAACGSARVLGLSLSTAMHGLVGLDGDRVPITPVVTWADARAEDEADQLHRAGEALALHRASGTPVHSMSPLTKLMWFADHEPNLCARVRSWVGLKELVVLRLTGQLVTELSSASGTGLLDLSSRQWCESALAIAGVQAHQLAPIHSTTDHLPLLGAVADQVGLPAGLPVVLGAGDGPLGNLGCGAFEPGVVGLSLGTSGALRMLVDSPTVDARGRLFCYALTEADWVSGGSVSNGGSVVRWAGEVFGPDLNERPRDSALLALAEQVPPGSDGLVMLPFLLAERAPLWNPTLPGSYLGVRRRHTRGHFVRAAVEGVALMLSTVLDELEHVHPVNEIRCTGGVFRSRLWRQVLAGMLGRPLLIGGPEGSALGAATLALFALDRAPTLGQALQQLAGEDRGRLAVATPADLARYEHVRSSVPDLVATLTSVADLFTPNAESEQVGDRHQ